MSTMAVGRGARAVGRETAWLVLFVWRQVRYHFIRTLVILGAVTYAALQDEWLIVIVALLPGIVQAAWSRFRPGSYHRRIIEPMWQRATAKRVRKSWPALMETCGLARRGPVERPVVIPRLQSLMWRDGQLVAMPGLLLGQTVEDVEAASERLRVSHGAHRVRIIANPSMTSCEIVWSFGSPLTAPFDAVVPNPATARPSATSVVLGRSEDGTPWELSLYLSTLVAGSAGSGKGSLVWGLVFALGPGIKSGLVEVLGIDLKSGMELQMGNRLFTSLAFQVEEAVVMLEATAERVKARAAQLAGHVRQHTATTADPHVVIVIDELAALIAYTTDRALQKRAETALNLILSQGRAVGFVVVAFVQDPRKETVSMRHLFQQIIALRLREAEEVRMTLGEGALAAGARCHRIPFSTPGVGYVVSEGGRPVQVRAGFVSDQMIRTCATLFPAVRQIPITIPDPAEAAPVRSPRRRTKVDQGQEW